MSPQRIALIVLLVIVIIYVIYYVYKHYYNTVGISCSANTDCSSGQYCGLVSKKCLVAGTCLSSASGKMDDCGLTSTCTNGTCTLKTGYCHSVGPINTTTNTSDCSDPTAICVASTSQCVTPSAALKAGSSIGAPCTVAEDCAANDGWPSKTAPNQPCNYYCSMPSTPSTSGPTYGTCKASTCCTAVSGCPNANYSPTNTTCDVKSGFCIPPTAAAKQQAAKLQAAKK